MSSSHSPSTGRRIKFTNPPVNELVIALFHLPLMDLKAQHIGIYWDKIRHKYPLSEQHPVVFDSQSTLSTATLMAAPDELYPLPRFWFYNNALPTLIQVQRNSFMLNWRLLPSLPNAEYPHYETVAEDFWRELDDYKAFIQDFVGGKLDPIQRCELTYVNVIPPNELFSKPEEFVNVLPLLSSLYSIENSERRFAGMVGNVGYRVNPSLLIELGVRLGRRTDMGEIAVGLELKAHGVPSDLSLEAARGWFDAAHDATYKLFLDATGKEMQEKIWRPR
jgi:uncharacterized protein (TIGR04255 family)